MKAIFRTMLFVALIVFVSTACTVPFAPRLVRGSGDIIVEERDVSDFEEILVTGAGRVIVTQGGSESLSIETDDNLMQYIETEVRGNTLEIGFKDGVAFSQAGGRKVIDPSESFIFRISVNELTAITLSGAARLEVEKLKTDSLIINLSGAGDITVEDLNAAQLDVILSGAGDVKVAGKVVNQDIRLNGFGRYQAFDLESQGGAINISGAGGANVWVTEVLDVVISGAGDVEYYGTPTVNREINGLGRVQGLGEK